MKDVFEFWVLAKKARQLESRNTGAYLTYAAKHKTTATDPQLATVIEKRAEFVKRALRMADVAKALEVLADSPEELSEIAELLI